jgi:hypothetical protein
VAFKKDKDKDLQCRTPFFAETEALPPIISERTNYVTGEFIINLAHLQIPM